MNFMIAAAAVVLYGVGIALLGNGVERGSKDEKMSPIEYTVRTIVYIPSILAVFFVFINEFTIITNVLLIATAIVCYASVQVIVKIEDAVFSHRAQCIVGSTMTTIALFIA